MVKLSGSLRGLDLPPILEFLGALQASGKMHLSWAHCSGEVQLDRGRVVAASFGASRGLAALDALLVGRPGGAFAFSDATPPDQRDVDLDLPPER